MHAISKALVYATALGAAVQSTLAFPTEPRYVVRAPAQVFTSCTTPNTIAITFDDGPYRWNRDIVDALNAVGAKATFFLNGNNYGCIYDGQNPDNIRYAYNQGHQIASHTWAHQHLPSLSGSALEAEFTKTNDAIEKITGAVPAFVRPPYGEYNDEALEVAGELGQAIVTWDFDSGDSAGKSVRVFDLETSKTGLLNNTFFNQAAASLDAYEQLIDSKPNSVLTLNHETYSSTANQLLLNLIDFLQVQKYNLVTVAECLGADPYISTGSPSKPDATWAC